MTLPSRRSQSRHNAGLNEVIHLGYRAKKSPPLIQTGERPQFASIMSQEQWTAVDRYITDTLLSSDPTLEAALKASTDAGLPAISVAPNQWKLLQLLARAQGARSILEIGTLGG